MYQIVISRLCLVLLTPMEAEEWTLLNLLLSWVKSGIISTDTMMTHRVHKKSMKVNALKILCKHNEENPVSFSRCRGQTTFYQPATVIRTIFDVIVLHSHCKIFMDAARLSSSSAFTAALLLQLRSCYKSFLRMVVFHWVLPSCYKSFLRMVVFHWIWRYA